VFLDICLLLLKESQNPTFKARFKMKLTMIRQIIQTRNLVACSIFFYSSVVAASSAYESTLTIAPEATPPPTDVASERKPVNGLIAPTTIPEIVPAHFPTTLQTLLLC
jgi:hypothetical protein